MATGDERPSRLGDRGTPRVLPARVAARASRDRLAATPDDVLVAELAALIDRAFATSLPEEVVQSAVRHQVLDRVVAELAASGALDRAVKDALASDQMRLAIREVVESPEMRAALARQTTGLAEELVGSVRSRAAQLDDRVERRDRPAPVPFAGAVTRAVAFGIDASIVFLAYVSLSALVALVSTLFGTLRPEWLVGLLLTSGLLLLAGIYFVTFWSGAGQTPGMRLLRLRLLDLGGAHPPSGARSFGVSARCSPSSRSLRATCPCCSTIGGAVSPICSPERLSSTRRRLRRTA